MDIEKAAAILNDGVLGAFRNVPRSERLEHIVRYLSTYGGSDKLFMLVQYSTKLLVPLLQLRARAQHRAGFRTDPTSAAAEGWKRLSDKIGDSRTLWRLWGLLPILQWLISMEKAHPPTRKLLAIERMQAWSMLLYYPLEHVYYLASHRIIPVSQKRVGAIARWSCRFWMAYVILQLVHLREDMLLLKRREKAVRTMRLGSDDFEGEKVEIQRRKEAIRNETWVNMGYLPLTIHWSLKNGLYGSDVWTGLFGLVAAVASFRGGWAATAVPPVR